MTPSDFRDFIAKQCGQLSSPCPGTKKVSGVGRNSLSGEETLPESLNDWLHKPTAEIKQDDDKTN